MSRTVFWDTAAFLALANTRDALHTQAVIVSRSLASEKARLLTTDAVLTELANGLSKVDQRQLAQRTITMVQQSALLNVAEVIHVTPELWQRGWQLYCSRLDKAWGLTDCLSFTVMQEQDVHEAFTADHHFEQAGFICLLRPDR